MKRRLLALLISLQAAPLLAKEVYITVRRDFGPNEAPEVELHYVQSAPFTLRVYKPKDLKEFVTSQVDLRRAWREPTIELNSARYLFAGLNRTRLGLDWLRSALHPETRAKLKQDYGIAGESRDRTRLSEGPQRLVAGPDRFELVTEFVFDPDEGDAHKAFDVPGFDWWSSRQGRLREKSARLPKLAPGFYLVQVLQGDLEGQVVLVVNDLSASLQQSDGEAIVRVAHRDGRPADGARVEVRNLRGAWIGNGATDADGVLALKDVKDAELLAVIREKESVAIIDTEFFSTTAVFPDVYLYTDRPLYRRGNKVRFKGIVREPKSGLSRLVADMMNSVSGKAETARVSLVDLSGATVVSEIDAPLSSFGTFDGVLDLADADLNGVYRVTARLAGASHAGEIRVKDYVKPLFFLTVKAEEETLQAGGKLNASVKVERYAGGIPAGVKYSAELFRIKAESPQWVEDAGLSETGNLTNYYWDTGRAESVSVPYPVARLEDLAFDASGRSTFVLTLPGTLPGPRNFDYKFLLKIYARDPDGNAAVTTSSFVDARSEVVALARMSSVFASTDHPARLRIRALLPSGKPYGATKGKVTWTLTPYKKTPVVREVLFTTRADGRLELPVPVNRAGRLDAEVTLVDRLGQETTAEGSIVVLPVTPGRSVVDVSEVTILQEREVFASGETARALVLLPAGWGEKRSDRGRIYLTVAGRGIHEQRVQRVEGLTAWIDQPIRAEFGTAAYCVLAYPDPVRGWVERTLTFRIPPRDKILNVAVTPRARLVGPGQKQGVSLKVLDSAGRPVEAEVSISVADKAVLALQPEFRPSLLSFFYPLERLNLMSFFSREFQSYGYGERLAKRFGPNFSMSATKPNRKDGKDDDTAYWNARVVTDAQGDATVSFVLPGNQTTWKVSAVAADRNGRFGEGGAEFGTNAPITFSVAAPLFLRRGDRTQLRLLLSNQEKKARDVKVSVTLPNGVTSENPIGLSAHLSPGEEARGRGAIVLTKIDASGATAVRSRLETSGQIFNSTQSIRTLPDTTSFLEVRDVKLGEPILLSLGPDSGTLEELHLYATGGLAATVIPSLRWLMEYPYGCVEQTTSATVPSLLVKQLFDTKGTGPGRVLALDEAARKRFLAGKDAPRGITAEKTLEQAMEFAEAGIARLKAMQAPDGSYGWWPGSGRSDPTMTAVVLLVLSSLDDPAPLRTLDARKSVGWLKSRSDRSDSSLAVAITYIESRLYKLRLGQHPGNAIEVTARFQAEWAKSHGTVLDEALMLLSLKNFGFAERPGLTAPLLADVEAKFGGYLAAGESPDASTWTPLGASWPEYPGRLSSTLAVAARALNDYGRLDAEATRRFTRRLLSGFNGRSFGSTFETSQVLVHTAWLLRQELAKDSATTTNLRVLVEGIPVPAARLTRIERAGGVELVLKGAEAARGSVTLEGTAPEASLRALLVSRVPLDRVSPVTHGWDLKKEYFLLDAGSGRQTPLTGPVKVGDLVFVRISFASRKSERHPWSSSYYNLTDQIPAGFGVVEDDKVYDAPPSSLDLHGAGYAVRDVRPDRIRWSFAFERGWMDRAFQTGYVLRAQFSGDFATGVARFEDFYDESLFSQTASRSIAVLDDVDSHGRAGVR